MSRENAELRQRLDAGEVIVDVDPADITPSDIASDAELVLDRSDPAQNMARFYVLAIEPTLFGDVALVREWGRRGCSGRRRLDLYGDQETAAEALQD